MYIQFVLPHGGAGIPAAHKLWALKADIKEWAQRYEIAYRQKTVKHTHRVTFDDDAHYVLFAMSWPSSIPYQLIGVGA
jgi:hypothetical protein